MKTRRHSIAVGLGLVLVTAVAPAAAASPDSGAVELTVAGAPESTTLFGDVVVVPGSSQTESLQVTNVGEMAGTLKVEVVDATATGDPGAFLDDLTVNGVPAATLNDTVTPIVAERTLKPGEVVTVPVTLAFNVSDQQPAPGRRFSFAVRATLTGEPPETGEPQAAGGPQATTGGVLTTNRTELLWAAGALLTAGLMALVPVLRRRRKDHSA